MAKAGRTASRPLTSITVKVLRAWLAERAGAATDPLFPTRTGGALSRDAVEHRIALHSATATATCPSLRHKQVSAHVLRHYVNGWVMWPVGVFPLAGLPGVPIPAT
jgi:integrase/recombinase XerD